MLLTSSGGSAIAEVSVIADAVDVSEHNTIKNRGDPVISACLHHVSVIENLTRKAHKTEPLSPNKQL